MAEDDVKKITKFTDPATGRFSSTEKDFSVRIGWEPYGTQGFWLYKNPQGVEYIKTPTGINYKKENYEKFFAAGDHNLGPQPSMPSGTRDTSSIANIWAGKGDPYTSHLTGRAANPRQTPSLKTSSPLTSSGTAVPFNPIRNIASVVNNALGKLGRTQHEQAINAMQDARRNAPSVAEIAGASQHAMAINAARNRRVWSGNPNSSAQFMGAADFARGSMPVIRYGGGSPAEIGSSSKKVSFKKNDYIYSHFGGGYNRSGSVNTSDDFSPTGGGIDWARRSSIDAAGFNARNAAARLLGGAGPAIFSTNDAFEGLYGPARSEVARAQFLNSTRQNAGAMFASNSLFKQFPNAAVGQWTRNTPMGDAFGGHKKPLDPTGFTYKEEKQYGMLTDSNWWGKKHYDKQLKDAKTFSVGGSDKGFLGQLEAGGGIPGIVAGGLNKVGGGISSSLAVIKDIITKPPIPGSALSMLASASKGGEGFRVDSGGSLYRTAGQTTSTGAAIYTPMRTLAGSNKGQGYSKPEGGFAGRFNPVGSGGGFVYPGQQQGGHIGGKGPGGGRGHGAAEVESGGLTGIMGAGGNTAIGQIRHMALWNALMIPLGVGAAVGSKALGYGDAVSKPQFALTGVNFTESMRENSKDWALNQKWPYTTPQQFLKGLKETASAWGEPVTEKNLPAVQRAAELNEMAAQYAMTDSGHVARFSGRYMNILKRSPRYKNMSRAELHEMTLDSTSGIMAEGTAHGEEFYTASKVALPQMIARGDDYRRANAEISRSVETIGGGMTGTAMSKLTTGQGGAHTSMAKSDIFHDRLTENYAKYKGSPKSVSITKNEINDKYFKKHARELEARERLIVSDMKDERKRTARLINLANQLHDYDEMGIGAFSKKLNMQRVMPYLSNFQGQQTDDIIAEHDEKAKSFKTKEQIRQQHISRSPGDVKGRYEKSWEKTWDKSRNTVGKPVWTTFLKMDNSSQNFDYLLQADKNKDVAAQSEIVASGRDAASRGESIDPTVDLLKKASQWNKLKETLDKKGTWALLKEIYGGKNNWAIGGMSAEKVLGMKPDKSFPLTREGEKASGLPSEERIQEDRKAIESGDKRSIYQQPPIILNLQVITNSDGSLQSASASQQKPPVPGSPANAPVGATQSSSPTGTFTWPSLTNPIGGK